MRVAVFYELKPGIIFRICVRTRGSGVIDEPCLVGSDV